MAASEAIAAIDEPEYTTPVGLLGVEEDEDRRSILERIFDAMEIWAVLGRMSFVSEWNRDQLSTEERHQLPIGEVIGFDHGHLRAVGDGCAEREEQRALCAGGDDQLTAGSNRSTGECAESIHEHLADARGAAILGVRLLRSGRETGVPRLRRAWRRRKGIDVPVRKINGHSLETCASHDGIEIADVLPDFLSRRVLSGECCELIVDRFHRMLRR